MGRNTVFSLEDNADDASLDLDTPSNLDDQFDDAYSELDEHSEGINELLDQSDEAQDAVDTMSNVQDTLEGTDTISTEAMHITQICINSLYKRLGMNEASLISLESVSQSVALETIGEGIKKIVDTLKKAIAYIWSKLVTFYNFVRTKILGLFKKKHTEIKAKVDDTPPGAYTQAQAKAKLEPFTDLGIFTAFSAAGKYVHEGMVLTQMLSMEKAVDKLSHLNEYYKEFLDMMTALEKECSTHAANPKDHMERNSEPVLKMVIYQKISMAIDEFNKKHFSAHGGSDPLFMENLPYYEELDNPNGDTSVLPRFRHQRGNGVSPTQAFISPGQKDTLERLLEICKNIEVAVERSSKDIANSEQLATKIRAKVDANDITLTIVKAMSNNYTKVAHFVAYINHEVITLATKSVRETYRYIELSTKAAEVDSSGKRS